MVEIPRKLDNLHSKNRQSRRGICHRLLEIIESRCSRLIIFCTRYNSRGWYKSVSADKQVTEAIMDRIVHAYEILIRRKNIYAQAARLNDQRKNMIITPNLESSHWNTVFGDNRLIAALIESLINHSHIVVSTGPGHHHEESMQRQKGGKTR